MNIKTHFPPEFLKEEAKTLVVSTATKRLWAVMLDLLLEFDRVCRKNGIKYMIDAGTLLGAVRHGGFIPWDNDVDVVMLREEYEKLNKIASKEFSSPYFWQTYVTDKEHCRGFATLRNSSTTYIARFEMIGNKPLFRHNQGVPIDVFICDNVPDKVEQRSPFFKHLAKIQSVASKLNRQGHSPWSLRLVARIPDLVQKLAYSTLSAFSRRSISQRLLAKLDAEAQRYNGEPTEYVSRLTFCSDVKNRLCYIFPRRFLEDLIEIEFEGYKFLATSHWEEYLTLVYGNWREHVIGAGGNGSVFIDLEKPYTEYVK